MNWDDIIYVTLLFLGIAFGKSYRGITDPEQKKLIGTAFGLLIVIIVSGFHALHTFISVLIGGLIVTNINRRQCHLVCFAFMFGYLFFFRLCYLFGIPLPPGHTNMIQMIFTLKVIGLAFEVNECERIVKKESDKATDYERETIKVTLSDVFHYCFNYVGILTGPYYRYRTYLDYFRLPFKDYADCSEATKNKLKWVPLFAFVYLSISYIWPFEYALSTEFYEDRSIFYRLMYVWPVFATFRMRIYIGITLSECVCTMAGFGAYPIESDTASGCGPRKEYKEMEKTPSKYQYDFETIRNIDAYTTDTCWTFREALKSWNMCVQYWLAVNVYKRFPSKAYRTMVTLLVSALWHGVYPGYYFCILGAPVYLPIEDLHHKLYRKEAEGLKRRIIDIFFWISKFFAFSYLGIAFQLMTFDKIWYYYGSVYHLGYIYFAVLYGIGLAMAAQQKKRRKSGQKSNDKQSIDDKESKKVKDL